MARRKNRYSLDRTPIAVNARVLVGNDNKTFYVMRRVGKRWKKTIIKGGRPIRWKTTNFEEALIVLEKELCKVLSRKTAKFLNEQIIKDQNILAVLGD